MTTILVVEFLFKNGKTRKILHRMVAIEKNKLDEAIQNIRLSIYKNVGNRYVYVLDRYSIDLEQVCFVSIKRRNMIARLGFLL